MNGIFNTVHAFNDFINLWFSITYLLNYNCHQIRLRVNQYIYVSYNIQYLWILNREQQKIFFFVNILFIYSDLMMIFNWARWKYSLTFIECCRIILSLKSNNLMFQTESAHFSTWGQTWNGNSNRFKIFLLYFLHDVQLTFHAQEFFLQRILWRFDIHRWSLRSASEENWYCRFHHVCICSIHSDAYLCWVLLLFSDQSSWDLFQASRWDCSKLCRRY